MLSTDLKALAEHADAAARGEFDFTPESLRALAHELRACADEARHMEEQPIPLRQRPEAVDGVKVVPLTGIVT